jgi:hypothetical protein
MKKIMVALAAAFVFTGCQTGQYSIRYHNIFTSTEYHITITDWLAIKTITTSPSVDPNTYRFRVFDVNKAIVYDARGRGELSESIYLDNGIKKTYYWYFITVIDIEKYDFPITLEITWYDKVSRYTITKNIG